VASSGSCLPPPLVPSPSFLFLFFPPPRNQTVKRTSQPVRPDEGRAHEISLRRRFLSLSENRTDLVTVKDRDRRGRGPGRRPQGSVTIVPAVPVPCHLRSLPLAFLPPLLPSPFLPLFPHRGKEGKKRTSEKQAGRAGQRSGASGRASLACVPPPGGIPRGGPRIFYPLILSPSPSFLPLFLLLLPPLAKTTKPVLLP